MKALKEAERAEEMLNKSFVEYKEAKAKKRRQLESGFDPEAEPKGEQEQGEGQSEQPAKGKGKREKRRSRAKALAPSKEALVRKRQREILRRKSEFRPAGPGDKRGGRKALPKPKSKTQRKKGL